MAALFLLSLLLFTSCKRSWTCSIETYSIIAIKGSDTVDNYVVLGDASVFTDNPSYFQGLVNYYKSNGYVLQIDSAVNSQSGIIDKSGLKALEDDGFKCVPVWN